MSDDNLNDRLLRVTLPGRPSFLGRRETKYTAADVFAPGRPSLELSVLLSALAIVIPMLSIGAGLFAVRSSRQGHPRARAALIAAVWCGVLGVIIRLGGGLEVLP